MANTYTTRFNLTKPEVGADTNAWGGHLNANFDTIDSNMVSLSLGTAQTMTGALNLPSNGLNVGSGQLSVAGGNVTSSGNITASGNVSGVNGAFSGTLAVTGSATFSSTMSIAGVVTASTAPTLGGHLTNKTYVDGQGALKLNLTGGTLTGMLTLFSAPTLNLHAATKKYVDDAVVASLSGGLPTSGGTMTGTLTFAASQPTATTTAANIVQLTDSISSTSVTTAATPNSVKTSYDLANAALPKAGGTMTGNIVFAGTQPTATTTTAAIVQLTDSIASTSVSTAATPNSVKTAYDLANAALPKSGGTMTGALALPANGLNVGSGQLNVSGGNVSCSGNLSGVNASFSGTLAVTGAATFSSTLTASVAPTLGGHLTNKTYVDAQNALKLSLAGGTMTGAITLAGNPSGALDAAPKQYVDSAKSTIDAYTITAGSGLSGGGAINGSPTLSITSGGVTPAKLSQPFTSATAQTANAVNIDFTGIPSWVKRITVSFSSVATSTGTSTYPLIQIGSSAGFETTGYLSGSIEIGLGGRQFTSGFGINSGSVNAFSGHIVLTNVTGNTWAISGTTIRYSDTTGHISTGTKTLSGTIDRLRVTTSNSAAYSSGTINVFYE